MCHPASSTNRVCSCHGPEARWYPRDVAEMPVRRESNSAASRWFACMKQELAWSHSAITECPARALSNGGLDPWHCICKPLLRAFPLIPRPGCLRTPPPPATSTPLPQVHPCLTSPARRGRRNKIGGYHPLRAGIFARLISFSGSALMAASAAKPSEFVTDSSPVVSCSR